MYSWAQNGSSPGSASLIALQDVKHTVIRSLRVILTCSWLLPDFLSIAPSRWPFMLERYVQSYYTTYSPLYWVVSLDEPILTILTIQYARRQIR